MGFLAKWKSVKPRQKRMYLYLAILLGVLGWKVIPRPWFPTVTLETAHHIVYSTATREQAQDTAQKMELLYQAYSNVFGTLPKFQRDHPKLKVKLFKDRKEFRWINPGLGWAEAYYRFPYCKAYYSAAETNPYHWMLHEGAHQLNQEVPHLDLAKWLEEGVADYFGTSRLRTNNLVPGRIDPTTYPVWWLEDMATSSDLAENIRNGSVIPLKAIITNRGGPSMRKDFNLYYLHWWTLTHFVFESPKYRGHALKLAEQGGGLEAFEKVIGPVERAQGEWHAFVRELKKVVAGNDPKFLRTGELPEGILPKE
jgi:hypothetical protein